MFSDFFRLANSSTCGSLDLSIYSQSQVVASLSLSGRDHGWVSPSEVQALFSGAFAAVFGKGVAEMEAEPYGRASLGELLRVGGKAVALTYATTSGGSMQTGSFVGALASMVAIEAVPGSCPDTAYAAFHGQGTVGLTIAAYNATDEGRSVREVAVSLGGEEAHHLPEYELAGDKDWAVLSAKRLAGIRVTVAKSALRLDPTWFMVDVSARYEAFAPTTVDQTVSVGVELRDVSEPGPARVPALGEEYYTLAFLAFAAVAGILLVLLPVILYREFIQGLRRHGLPLPFFRYTTQFRGW